MSKIDEICLRLHQEAEYVKHMARVILPELHSAPIIMENAVGVFKLLQEVIQNEDTKIDQFLQSGVDYWKDRAPDMLFQIDKILEKHEQLLGRDWYDCDEYSPEDGEVVLCSDGDNVFMTAFDADQDAPFGDMNGITCWTRVPEPPQRFRELKREE